MFHPTKLLTAAASTSFTHVNRSFLLCGQAWPGGAATDPGTQSMDGFSKPRCYTARAQFSRVWQSIFTNTTQVVFTMFHWWLLWHGSPEWDSWPELRPSNLLTNHRTITATYGEDVWP